MVPGELDQRPRYSTDPVEIEKNIIVETYRAPGPGGQRKNKKETAVKITHIPTGVTAVASERRSQAMNREVALERLKARLEQMNRHRKPRLKTGPSPAVRKRREEQKKRRSEKKRERAGPVSEDAGP